MRNLAPWRRHTDRTRRRCLEHSAGRLIRATDVDRAPRHRARNACLVQLPQYGIHGCGEQAVALDLEIRCRRPVGPAATRYDSVP